MAHSILSMSLTALLFFPWGSLGSFSLNFSKVKHRSEPPRLAQRDHDLSLTIDNGRMLYLVDFLVGTPPQPIRAALDTGSADLWLPNGKHDTAWGYEVDDSETSLLELNTSFHTSYGSGHVVLGDFVHDIVHLGGVVLEDTRFGVAYEYNPMDSPVTSMLLGTYGIMGIGPELLEAGTVTDDEPVYRNIVGKLKDDGIINTEAFSLFLDSADTSYGTILFGAVDSSKYEEPLISLPLVDNPIQDNHPYYAVQLTALEAQSPDGITSFAPTNHTEVRYAHLDSGTTAIFLPQSLADPLFSYIGAIWDSDLGGAFVPCNISTADVILSFYFGGDGGAKINVPIADLILGSVPPSDGTMFADHTSACILQVYRSDPSYAIILGDAFLRSTYVVYDLENKQIAMAQANTNSTGERIDEITMGASGIPGVNKIMPSLDFNYGFIAQDAIASVELGFVAISTVTVGPAAQRTAITLEPPAAITASVPWNHTLAYLPTQGSITAVRPADAFYTSTGFVVPTEGMKDIVSPSTVAGATGTPTAVLTMVSVVPNGAIRETGCRFDVVIMVGFVVGAWFGL